MKKPKVYQVQDAGGTWHDFTVAEYADFFHFTKKRARAILENKTPSIVKQRQSSRQSSRQSVRRKERKIFS